MLATDLQQPHLRRQFHFQAMWIDYPTYDNLIHNSWHQPHPHRPSKSIPNRLQNTKKNLTYWKKHTFGILQTQICQITEELDLIQSC